MIGPGEGLKRPFGRCLHQRRAICINGSMARGVETNAVHKETLHEEPARRRPFAFDCKAPTAGYRRSNAPEEQRVVFVGADLEHDGHGALPIVTIAKKS